jgi:RNA polymerase sigma factor (sigma-70 family)
MATNSKSAIVQHLRRTALLPDGAGMTDGELLECFLSRRDGDAFAALVRRHGPMVWGVCRRILSSHQDAEDAFQATFLVLVRKAASVVPREMVANWLYGVAHQTALNARASVARRRTRERQVTPMPEPGTDKQDLWRDLQPVLDQELSRLPNKYRAAIVLCDLEGKTRKDSAQQLGIPEGTLSGWLTRGRALLAKRLARHGVAVSSVTLAGLMSQSAASAAVPALALSSTIRAARLLAAGHAAATGAISAKVVSLTEGVIRTMLLTKLKIPTVLVLIISAVGMGATGLTYHARAAELAKDSIRLELSRTDESPDVNDTRTSHPTHVVTREGKKDSKFTVGKETTYVAGPLDNEGYVDYETALNERLGKGIAPENNANVLLWQALRPAPKPTPMPAEFFQWLKLPAPSERDECFVDLARYATAALKLNGGEQTALLRRQRGWATQRPWVEKDYPSIAGWLKANERPLALVLEATRRPDYYNPLVSRKSGEEGWYGLIGALLPGAVKCQREVAPALAARAMLHAGQARFDEAWQDVLACNRLGRLIARGADHDEFLLGAAINQAAGNAALALLDRANPTAQQARAWLRDLQRLPPMPPVADKVDLGVRFTFLNTVMLARRSPVKTLRLIEILEGRPRLPRGTADPEPPQALIDALDWDALLRTGNDWHNRMVMALRVKGRADREQQLKRIEEPLGAPGQVSGTPADVIKSLREGRESSKELCWKLGRALIDFVLSTVLRMQTAADQGEQAERNLRLAFALATYHGEHGCYPKTLETLAPGYVEEVPNDFLSGMPLIYRPSQKGYLLYSVGVNGRDDGGHGPEGTPSGDDLPVRMPLSALERK